MEKACAFIRQKSCLFIIPGKREYRFILYYLFEVKLTSAVSNTYALDVVWRQYVIRNAGAPLIITKTIIY